MKAPADMPRGVAMDLFKRWKYKPAIQDGRPVTVYENVSTRLSVVKDEGVLVAFLASTPSSVPQLYVRIQNIGQGIGSQLLNLAKSESIGSLWLYTFAKNQNARRFYEKHGFKEVERESQNMYKLEAIKYVWQRVASEA